jgi:hypothetical protein
MDRVFTGVYVGLVSINRFDYMDTNFQADLLVYVATPLYLNSLINPFLYALKIPDIRRTLSKYIPWFKNKVEPQWAIPHPPPVPGIELR